MQISFYATQLVKNTIFADATGNQLSFAFSKMNKATVSPACEKPKLLGVQVGEHDALLTLGHVFGLKLSLFLESSHRKNRI